MIMKLSKKELLLVFLTMLFLKPDFINQIYVLDDIYNCLRVMAFIFLIFYGVYYKCTMSLPSVVICVVEIYVFINTVLPKCTKKESVFC